MSFSDVAGQQRRSRPPQPMVGVIDSSSESEFSRMAGVATRNVTQIGANTGAIRRLMQGLGTHKDTSELREKLHRVIEETKLLAQDTKSVVKQLGSMEGGYQGGGSDRRFEQRKIGEDFSRALKSFGEAVRDSALKERESVARSTKTRQRSDSEEERLGLLEAEKNRELMQVENDIEFNEAMIAEREAGIKEVESTVREVNEIFRDLAVIVNDQGQMIDDIESGVATTYERTSAATAELKLAASSKSRARRTICCLGAILVVVVVLILLILTNKI